MGVAVGGPASAGARVDQAGEQRLARLESLRSLAALAVLLIVQEGGGTLGQWWRFLTLTENLFGSTVLTVDGPIWSLLVELQFYALLPLIAVGVAWLARGSRRNAAVLLLVAGAAGAAL